MSYERHEYLLGLDPTIGYHTEDLVEELRLVGGYRLSRKMDRWSSHDISCVIFLINESWKNIIVLPVSKETKSYAFSPSCVPTKKKVFVKTQGRKERTKEKGTITYQI